MIAHNATATKTVLTRATGNFPTTSAYCTVKYRDTPRKSVHKPTMMIVAPSGREYLVSCWFLSPAIVKSCTSATFGRSDGLSDTRDFFQDVPTPMEAIVRLVRTYARKVRSEARWSRATLPEFSSVSAGLSLFATSRIHFRGLLCALLSAVGSNDSAPGARSEVGPWFSCEVLAVSSGCDFSTEGSA